jgi:hypothetical protein
MQLVRSPVDENGATTLGGIAPYVRPGMTVPVVSRSPMPVFT